MNIINIVKNMANVDLLKNTPNSIKQEESPYKSVTAPCVVFEDTVTSEVLYIARTVDSFNTVRYKSNEELFTFNKQEKISVLQDKFQAQYDNYLDSYPKAEVSSFDDKKSEALAYNLDINTPTPIIDNIVLGWGGTKADYIASILAKVHYLAQQEGAMVKTRDAIKACTTQDELDAIVV